MALTRLPHPAASHAINVMDWVRMVYWRRRLALSVFVAVVAAVAIYTFTTKRVYEAQASVLIDFEAPNVLSFKDVLDEGRMLGGYYETQTEVLKSRALAVRTASMMKLWTRPGIDADTEAGAVDALMAGLQILPVRSSRIVNIRFRASTPALAADVANTHARAYVQQSLENRFTASQDATAWLDAQLAKERTRVENAESALQKYREQYDAVSLKSGQDIVVQKLADLNAALTKAKTNRIEKEVQFRELSGGERERASLDSFPAVMSNTFIQQLKSDLTRLQREAAQLSESLGERHPTLIEKRAEVDVARKRLEDETRRVVRSAADAFHAAQAEEESLGRTLEAQKHEALALNGREIQYAALERDAESVRLVYQSLLQRAKETSVSRDLPATNIRILDAARPPASPVVPRTTSNMLLGASLGAFFAVGAVFIVEFFDERVKTPDDLRGQVATRFLGVVPEVAAADSGRLSILQGRAAPSFVEAIRGLRTSVLSAAPEESNAILVASASEQEGKTMVAGNLAIALAQARQRVVLIDADMRRPGVHTLFGQRLNPGLADVLAGTATLAEVIRPTSVPGLSVVSAGTPSVDASELLGSALFRELFAILKEHYAWVIVDSPPVLTVTDASVLAPQTAGIVFVVGSAMTPARAIQLAVEELESAGGRLIGTILNRVNLKQHRFYFSPYSRGEYGADDVMPSGDAPPPSTVFGRTA